MASSPEEPALSASTAAPPTVAVAASTQETVDVDEKADPYSIEWVKNRITLPGVKPEMYKEEHILTISDFLVKPSVRKLIAYVDSSGELVTQHSLPSEYVPELIYFIKDQSREITPETVNTAIQFGIVNGGAMDALLRLMGGVFVPIFNANKTWPESIKKEFAGQLHKFMASLTETSFQMKGSTVLYIPNELIGDVEKAAKEKDLVQRLESTLIHWTRQIKEVVNNQDNSEQGEDGGPLAEIAFWRSRTIDLSGIREQLGQPGVMRIVAVLEAAKSSYLTPFQKLSQSIQKGSMEAQDNLKFLSILQGPCEQLAKSEPKEIPKLLPTLLNSIRMIWAVSGFYNTPERVTGLLRKVSNEIIARCCAKISLSDIFDNDAEGAIVVLQESIDAGEAWKRQFQKTASLIAKKMPGRKWDLDESSIFAQIDAFVQRCKDLIEVCEGQMQFARKASAAPGFRGPMPSFGGTRGPEITKSINDIQIAFEKQINVLKNLTYSILDVKATHWHDDYNAFKNAVKDLQVMMTNVISAAFDGVSTVPAGVELLEAFSYLAKRDAIKRAVQKKTEQVWKMFTDDVSDVKKVFEKFKKNPPMHPSFPRYAGSAMWSKSLIQRIERNFQLLDAAWYLEKTREEEEGRVQYMQTVSALDEYIRKTYAEWSQSIEPDVMKRLDSNLMVRAEGDTKGLLDINFDKTLLRLFQEVQYWQKLNYDVPHAAAEIAQQRERLRVIREAVSLVVRDYNNILLACSTEERRLFSERIMHLDRKVSPGLNKLTWASKGIVEYYVKECRKYCREVHRLVMDFKDSHERIQRNCRTSAETLLVSIEKKRVYEEGHFEARQNQHREVTKKKLGDLHKETIDIMRSSYEVFKHDNEDVQNEWMKYVHKIDRMVEEALRTTVKRSLQEVSRAVNGDAKTEVHPLFKVNVILDVNKVELKPNMVRLTQMVSEVSRDLLTVVRVIARLSEPRENPEGGAVAGSDSETNLPPGMARPIAGGKPLPVDRRQPTFYDVISGDDDIMKITVQIMNGMNSIVDKIQRYLYFWDKYKHIWDLDKDAFIRRYAKLNRPLSTFDSDIQRYKELQSEITNEETIKDMSFIRIDCGPLKHSLANHCVQWQNKFTALLNQLASTELKALHTLFSSNTTKLRQPPLNLDQLADSLNLLHQLQEDTPKIEARFEPVQAQYKTLEKFEVVVKEEELEMLAVLPSKWELFKQMLQDTQDMLDKHKQNFKKGLLDQMEELAKAVEAARVDFLNRAPFDNEYTIEKAMDLITEFKTQVDGFRNREASMKPGLQIFRLEPPNYRDAQSMAKDLENLEGIWKLTDEWQASWNQWKTGQFDHLQVADMEDQAQKYQKRIQKLGRDIKHWKAWEALHERVNQFKRVMPLITDLRSEALRPRHWAQLSEEVGRPIDYESPDFTLEKVFELGLDAYSEIIASLSMAAAKELAIERQLEGIATTWASMPLDLIPYKNDHHKLRSTDDLFSALEDNMVTLSSMKASRFYLAFEQQVEFWEKGLSLVSEAVELIQTVQRAWMYLENIFAGSEDIRKQLPTESALFDNVNASWKQLMGRMVQNNNALAACQQEGLMDMLTTMNKKLEKIQKALDAYLETKRQAFPRFYFLSNDDLLEILGQSKDPQMVQRHIKKCFEGIQTLELAPPGKEGRKTFEALGMHAPDGEYVPFSAPVPTDGPVELWLTSVEAMMKKTLQKLLFQSMQQQKQFQKWIRDVAGQLLITSGQIGWTNDCTKALQDSEKGNKGAMRQMKKKQVSHLNRLTDMIKGQLTKIERLKLIALITIEVHARDVIDRMIKANCSSTSDFEWTQQLRFYWDKDVEDCVVRQTTCEFRYGYEYQGNNGRLVITPLTDRCYMTLTTALQLRRGGLPQGPAGTGKTETVKDLGKALAKYVIVFNCSDGLDYKSMGRFFSGLAQSGSWSCFDEFNRIDVEVLSVVAQQILSILNAIMQNLDRFTFEGVEIRLDRSCGIFVTMNPGYAGRSELPENLKALLRPISMMVPDSALIAEIMLFSEGFQTAKVLAKKLTTLYQLAIQQLSKQDHYDFGLRAVKSCLVAAGALKRSEPDLSEEVVLMRTLRDMNVPKFVADDIRLFMSLLSDLFPGVEPPAPDYGLLGAAIQHELKAHGLQNHQSIVDKTIQLYDTKATRHGNMLVGRSGAGKTVVWQTLQRALTKLKKDNVDPKYQAVKVYVINPKALTLNELYGAFDLATMEWTDGVLSKVMREACADEKPDEKWLLLDGPVDTLWIESMNTVLDDNKMLTLISGERISMPPQVSLLFEVEDLAVASPATVSRAGMVYLDANDLGWWPFVESWLAKREDRDSVEPLKRMFDKYVQRVFDLKKKDCTELIPITDMNAVQSLCALFDALATKENGLDFHADPEGYPRMIEMWFVFSLIWSVGAAVDEPGRKRLDMFLREIDAQFPSRDTIYEYYVDSKKRSWTLWEEKVPTTWKPAPDTPFYKLFVPTVDTVRNSFCTTALVKSKKAVLLVGNVGTGKTSVAQGVLNGLDETTSSLIMNFSAQTSSKRVQEIIEGRLEKRTKDVYAPTGGKRMVLFIDDLNMPAKDKFGFHPPIELLRLWHDYGFWYDRQKQVQKHVKDVQMMAAMGPPGGGRSAISNRFQSKFNLINVTFPNETQLKRIYSTMINWKLLDFEEEIKPLGDIMTNATYDLYNAVIENLLPTPAKSHYVFNLRDMSKVFQGLLRSTRQFYDSKESMIRLWVHECYRVFADRLTDDEDREWFRNKTNDLLNNMFSIGWNKLFKSGALSMFGDFMREGMEVPPFEELTDVEALKRFCEEKLEDFNVEPGSIHMDLVLFRDAIEHICRIIRVIRTPRGNMLLVGVGGSGRKSMARLAAYISEMKTFSVEITRNYRSIEFREDLKKIYQAAGVEKKATVFLFDDTQIVQESFLEDINSLLSSGEVRSLARFSSAFQRRLAPFSLARRARQVPNLFAPEELVAIRDAVRNDAKAAGYQDSNDALYAFFIERARNNLHVVLCMSPVGDAFRNRLRMFPALVNNTTIDWFHAWPAEALREVASRFLQDVDLGSEETKRSVADVFTVTHNSVAEMSNRMRLELKRYNYVTPTNFIELVKGYRELLTEKRTKIGEAANKLRNGLSKLEESRLQVQTMSVELEKQKAKVAKFQKECEDLLVVKVQEQRIVDEQQRQVTMESERITKEEAEVKIVKEQAQSELDLAMPALDAARKALEALNKKDLSEIKAYTNPPAPVALVMEAVMVLRKSDPSWAEAKRQLGDPNFLQQLINFDKDNITDSILSKIGQKYMSNPTFNPEVVGKVSAAAKSLCLWAIAMHKYGNIAKEVAPKRAKLKASMELLEKKTDALKAAQKRLQDVTDKVFQLKQQYDESVATKDRLRKESEELEVKLARAEKLVSGLAGERTRWEQSIANFEQQIAALVGDCLVAAAFLSYAGPFNSEYREELVQRTWLRHVRELQLPCSPDFSFTNFLAEPTDVRFWNIQGLPADNFSTENGVLVTRGRRWPLMIDPQGQANKWVKKMEAQNNLKVIDLKMPDFLRIMEAAIQMGTPVLLQDILEEVDPSLAPVLGKSFVKQAGRLVIRLGDKELEYNPDFRFYITTKLSNPHYPPEISTKTTICNFAVKEQGLEAQLLGIVVRRERPDLEEQKNELVMNVAAGKKKLVELEDEILRLLSQAKGSLLDDEELVKTLDVAKTTAEEVKQQLAVSEVTEKKIDAAREQYRPCAFRSSILFFVLYELSMVDPMYQFSLDAYMELFNLSISYSPKSEEVSERIKNLNEYHTYAVYKYACRGLFERHKLLFAFQMCVRVKKGEHAIHPEELSFLLRGGLVLDKANQPPNPCNEWLPELCWDHMTELSKLENFRNILVSFEQNNREWRAWYRHPEPETDILPGEWEGKCNELQRMIFIRCLRPDRLIVVATSFISNNLGPKYTSPPVFDLNQVYADSTPYAPIIFVLSAGVDPTNNLQQLAATRNMSDRFKSIALGQGQAPIATRMIMEGSRMGHWVFLANCHLMISWMPQLEKIIEQLQGEKIHNDFRLWLSSAPHPSFPIAILQRGLKLTTEPPKGIKANLTRLYNNISEQQFIRCRQTSKYRKLLFGLCYFHAVLVERRKFLTLGWNVVYDFSDSDFEVCENLLALYLDQYEQTPWDALRYLTAEANYGGRVTDDWDRRLLLTYMNQFYSEEALSQPQYKLSALPTYYIPEDGSLQSYRDYIASLPTVDRPEAFGQHVNAEISSQIEESGVLLDTMLSLQPQTVVAGAASREELVGGIVADILERCPAEIDYGQTVKAKADDPSALNVVLLQEIQRYNKLLRTIRASIGELQRGIKGLIVMSHELDEMANFIFEGKVPPRWGHAYPSLKPLAPWMRDLIARIAHLNAWAEGSYPRVYWLAGFTYPTGFLTALLQTSARKNNVSIDTLAWDFQIVQQDEKDIVQYPKEGAYIKGLFLEGAGWNADGMCLAEPQPMELVVPMPIVHFKPVESRKKVAKGYYSCPTYMYPVRTGTRERPSYMIAVDLKSAPNVEPDHWTKRGTALLLSLAQ
eukprot:tig00000056_g24072.t1